MRRLLVTVAVSISTNTFRYPKKVQGLRQY